MSDDEKLQAEGDDKAIYLAALSEFSDTCESPELRPECPFYELAASGPSCGEQCVDLIAAHGSGVDVGSAFDFGNGFVLYERKKRRPRRGPDKDARPFDAGAVYLRDKEKPTDARSTIALLYGLRERLSFGPSFDEEREARRYEVGAAIEELVRRGFPGPKLHRALAEHTSTSVFVAMGAQLFVASEEDDVGDAPVADAWKKISDEWSARNGKSGVDGFTSLMVGGLDDKIAAWFADCPLSEMADWHPPLDLDALEAIEPAIDAAFRDECIWLLERFTRTYLNQWPLNALHLEWDYLHGSRSGCTLPKEMHARQIPSSDVATAIAEDAHARRNSELSSSSGRRINKNDFIKLAVDHLENGRFNDAVALYEGLHQIDPQDSWITNNLAFCLIGTNPERALELFEQLEENEAQKTQLLVANMVFLLYYLGRPVEARAKADEMSEASPLYADVAWLWFLERGRLVLKGGQNPAKYVSALVVEKLADQTNEQ